MDILIISPRKNFWLALAPDFQGKGFAPDYVDTLEKALDLIRKKPPVLVILDQEATNDKTSTKECVQKIRRELTSILKVNAIVHTAVVSSMSPDVLHEATEGYGVLLGLPLQADASDIERLSEALRKCGVMHR